MSHDYRIRCKRCLATSEEYNHAQEQLADAVRAAYPLWLAAQTGWETSCLNHNGLFCSGNVSGFLVEHFDHGLEVISEYLRDGDNISAGHYPPLPVEPILPQGQLAYGSLVLNRLTEEAKKVRDEIAEQLVKLDKIQDGEHP